MATVDLNGVPSELVPVAISPDQLEDLRDGWHYVVVLGVADFDVLHSGLTMDYCDGDTKRLWDKIAKQMSDQALMRKMEGVLG